MRKKILFVIESLSGGGAEKVLTTIVKNIDKTKFDVTVLTVVKTGVYVEEVEKYCTLISMLPEYEKLTNPIAKMKYKVDYKKIYKEDCAKIYKKYVKNVYDVEIAFVEGFATKLVASSWNRNSKKIAWVHVDLIQRAYADEYFLNNEEHKTCYKKYDKVICVSKSVLDVYKQKFDLENGTVCYNPVDSHELKKYKKVSFIIWLVQCCLLVVFFVYKSYQFSTIMLYTHIVIVIAAVAQTMSETKNR